MLPASSGGVPVVRQGGYRVPGYPPNCSGLVRSLEFEFEYSCRGNPQLHLSITRVTRRRARVPLLWGAGRTAAMLTLAHGHHGAALPPTRWLLPLVSAGCTKSPDFVLGAAECPRHAEEDARESGADQRSLLVTRIVKFVGHFSEQGPSALSIL